MATALELIRPHNVTQIPHWFYNLNNQFDYYKVAVTTYVVLMQWFHDNSPPDYIQHLAKGSTGYWPCLADAMEQQILDVLLGDLQRVTGDDLANLNTNQCYHK
jgi:hypothetical protein